MEEKDDGITFKKPWHRDLFIAAFIFCCFFPPFYDAFGNTAFLLSTVFGGGVFAWVWRQLPTHFQLADAKIRGALHAPDEDRPPILIENEIAEVVIGTDEDPFSDNLEAVYYLMRPHPKTEVPAPFTEKERQTLTNRLTIWSPMTADWAPVTLEEDGIRLSVYGQTRLFPKRRGALKRRFKKDRPRLERLLPLLFAEQTDPRSATLPEAAFLAPTSLLGIVIEAAEQRSPAQAAEFLAIQGDDLPPEHRLIFAFYANMACSDEEIGALLFHRYETVRAFARRVWQRLAKPPHTMLHYSQGNRDNLKRCLTELQAMDDRISIPHSIALLTDMDPKLDLIPLVLRQNDSRVLGFLHHLLKRGSLEERRIVVDALAKVGDRSSIYWLRIEGEKVLFRKSLIADAVDKIEGRHPRTEDSGALSVAFGQAGHLSPAGYTGDGTLSPAESGTKDDHDAWESPQTHA